jgi:hypothetical protein
LDFELDRPPYDARARDRIGSVSYLDICKEIEVFRKAGYSDDEIAAVYDLVRDAACNGSAWHVNLPKPVKVTLTVQPRG